MELSQEEQLQQLLTQVQQEPSHRNYWYAHKKIAGLELSGDPKDQLQISLLSSHTIDLLKIYLDIDARFIGLDPSIWVGPFNQAQQQILDQTSLLYQKDPDLVLLNLHLPALTSKGFFTEFPRLTTEQRFEEMNKVISTINMLMEVFCKNSDALLLFSNFIVPSSSPLGILDRKQEVGLLDFYQQINRQLFDLYRDHSQVHIFDLDCVASDFGKSRVTNPKMYYRGTIKFSEEFLPHLSHAYMGYVKALKNKNRKALILDLDNTLWGGIVGEDGIDGIKLNQNHPGKEYYEFQQAIKQLYNRGIILALNSKNNFEDAIEVIRDHPAMVLREDNFAAMRINWLDKVQNIIDLAEELNIGLDSLVFVDDNPVERQRVKSSLPEVLVLDLPEDPSYYVSTLHGLNDFNVLSLTNEDMKRGEMYVARRKRKSLESEVQSMDDFIKSLEIKATIRLADEFALPRVTSLVNRTNQFNVTTRRFTEAQIQNFHDKDPSMHIYTLQVTDKFGDEGIVGVAMVKDLEDHWDIINFMMSCRVIGRKIETAFLQKIQNDAFRHGIHKITGMYIPTKKNKLVISLFDQHGFHVDKEDEGTKYYSKEVSELLDYPEFIDVITD